MKLLFAVKVHRLPVGSGEISFAAMHRAEMPMVSLGCMDRVMAANQILDFDGGNVLAAYLQDIFQAAGPLKVPPPNLTVLAKRNGGKFPDAHVSAVIRGGRPLCRHMVPATCRYGGPVFHSISGGRPAEVQLRVANLTKYIQSLQK